MDTIAHVGLSMSCALAGLGSLRTKTQGDALGYRMLPRWGRSFGDLTRGRRVVNATSRRRHRTGATQSGRARIDGLTRCVSPIQGLASREPTNQGDAVGYQMVSRWGRAQSESCEADVPRDPQCRIAHRIDDGLPRRGKI